jgi:type I restriction enzyme S subunit
VPEGWEWTKLSTISISIQYGITESAKSNGYYKFLRITDIQNNKVDWESVPYVCISDDKANEYLLYNNDIVFARTGATVGKSYLISNLNDRAVFASYLIRIKLPTILDVHYIKLFLESGFYWEQIADKSVGIGQPNVNGTSLGELIIPIPPLPEQLRITSNTEHLLSYIDIIDENKLSLEQFIKQSKTKVLDLAVHGKLVPQDPDDEPASVLLERIRKSQKTVKPTSDISHYPFELPQGWVWCRISAISASIQYGVTESAKSEGNYKFLRITDIQDNLVDWDSVPYVYLSDEKAEDYLLSNDDIVFARTGATVGKSYLISGLNKKAVFASYLIRIKLLPLLNAQYVKLFFESDFYWEQILEKSVGIGQPNVNGTSLKELVISLPPLVEQKRIVSKIEQIFSQLDNIEKSLRA